MKKYAALFLLVFSTPLFAMEEEKLEDWEKDTVVPSEENWTHTEVSSDDEDVGSANAPVCKKCGERGKRLIKLKKRKEVLLLYRNLENLDCWSSSDRELQSVQTKYRNSTRGLMLNYLTAHTQTEKHEKTESEEIEERLEELEVNVRKLTKKLDRNPISF